MTIHDLKIAPRWYPPLAAGAKTFEIRLDDRGFQVGDILHLRETRTRGDYTGRAVLAEITYILRHDEFPGLAPGYVAMAINRLALSDLSKRRVGAGGEDDSLPTDPQLALRTTAEAAAHVSSRGRRK